MVNKNSATALAWKLENISSSFFALQIYIVNIFNTCLWKYIFPLFNSRVFHFLFMWFILNLKVMLWKKEIKIDKFNLQRYFAIDNFS